MNILYKLIEINQDQSYGRLICTEPTASLSTVNKNSVFAEETTIRRFCVIVRICQYLKDFDWSPGIMTSTVVPLDDDKGSVDVGLRT